MHRSLPYNADGFCVEIEHYTVFLHIQGIPHPVPLYPASAFERREGAAIPLADLLRVFVPDLSAKTVAKQAHHQAELLYRGRQTMQPRTKEAAQWAKIGDYKASIVWFDARKMEWFVTPTTWEMVASHKKNGVALGATPSIR